MEELQEIQLLGSGAFGKCYLCVDPQTNAKVVVKQIDISTMSLEEKKEAYREVKVMAAFDHPNIIHFRDVYTTTNGKLNIVMDYADGGDLAAKIKAQKGKFFSEATVLHIFVQLCLALKHVHDRKILHRDIKAQNVFLMQNGIVKLGDFGIAKVLTSTVDNARTMVGTPYYLSPEIVDNKPYNFKSDVWSLGVLLYELCTLKPPFDASSFHFLALKIVRGAYPPLPPHFSRDLKSLVSQMLSIDPNKRPSIAQILKIPFVNKRIQNLLTESIKQKEFSHTILHNQQFVGHEDDRPQGRMAGERARVVEEKPKVVDEKPKIPEERVKVLEESKSKPKTKTFEKSKKKDKTKKIKEKTLTKEEKDKAREDKAKKREEDRLKMIEDIKSKKKQKQGGATDVQWIGTLKEQEKLIEKLQEACNDSEVLDDSDLFTYSVDADEMIVKEDVIKNVPESTQPRLVNETPSVNQIEVLDRSTHTRMELLRLFLEDKLGIDAFVTSYNLLKQFIGDSEAKWDYENIYQRIKGVMTVEHAKQYLPLIHTLIFMEGESDSINLG